MPRPKKTPSESPARRRFASEAEERAYWEETDTVGMVDWSRAERLATPEAWQRYLGEFPDGRNTAKARQRLIDFIPPDSITPDGRYVVQLGAYSTEAAARADLARAAGAHMADLSGIGIRVIAPRDAADSIWRLRTDALAEVPARDLCARLREGGVDCVPLPDDSAGEPPP